MKLPFGNFSLTQWALCHTFLLSAEKFEHAEPGEKENNHDGNKKEEFHLF